MPAMIDRDILSPAQVYDAERDERLAQFTEALFAVQDADAALRKAQDAGYLRPVTVLDQIAKARHLLRFALSALD